MDSCLVQNKGQLLVELMQMCDYSASLDMGKGTAHIQKTLKNLIENARNSSDPESQLGMLKEALHDLYNSGDPYGDFIDVYFPLGDALLLFNITYDQSLTSPTVSPEEAGKASKVFLTRNFLESKFKNAPNAKLYFQRSVLNDMVETFLVKRSGESPQFFTSIEEMNRNVLAYKQELLDRVFRYFDEDHFLKDSVKNFPRKMYHNGEYTGVIEVIKSAIDARLKPELFTESVKSLDTFYREYRDGDKAVARKAETFLQAYNAWVMLQNFDTLVKDTFGSIIKVDGIDFNKHIGSLHRYQLSTKATNMWNNWTTSDDIADMADVISEVTQALINTSRLYKWGNGEAYPDRYVSFNDFNYVVGFIKRCAMDPSMVNIDISQLQGINNVSLDTKRILLRQTASLIEQGRSESVTWPTLIACLNENPQRYMHAIFDIMCNTNLLELDQFNNEANKALKVNDYTKNLIWSFYKEVFGGEGHNRSLYRLHTITENDNVYRIITQLAASTFPEDYLQYYEKNDGSIGTRLLKDYAIEGINNTIFQNIQQTASTLGAEQYRMYGITYSENQEHPGYLQEIKISIPIDDTLTFNIKADVDKVYVDRYSSEQMKLIWKNPKVQRLFIDLLGVDLENDPDLKNAFLEIVGSTKDAVRNLSNIIGRVVFTTIVNNEFAPRYQNATKSYKALKSFVENQYGASLAGDYVKGINRDIGLIPVLPVKLREALLKSLTMAMAINDNLLSAAQSKTGEGTSLANYALSRMRNFYPNQVEIQCKRGLSAVKNLEFVVNSEGLFEGILSRRELKTTSSNQQSTQFSDQQSFQLSFINDFVAAFVPNPDPNSYIKNGHVSFLPTVNSDKSQIDGLLVNLSAKSSIKTVDGKVLSYIELSDSQIEEEMMQEFGSMYEQILHNINTALHDVCKTLDLSGEEIYDIVHKPSNILRHHALLNIINNRFKDRADLGKKPKERIINGLHQVITQYNQTHTKYPIMLSEHVHYVFDKNGLLTSNKTLESLWGRFNPNADFDTQVYLAGLYSNEADYLAFMDRNHLSHPYSAKAFFKYKEHLTVENLMKMDFKVFLRGSDEVVRHNQPEIQFLRGEAIFTKSQLEDPAYANLVALNNEMREWVEKDGIMILAKGIVNGKEINIKTWEDLNVATNLRIHPMLSKLNRLDYLCSQQYTISTVGSHYVHKGSDDPGSVLIEEARRWLASNKRNVAATSTVHLFQNKQLDGAPSTYNISIIDDVYFDLYNVMGDLYKEGHAPLDGGMFSNGWFSELENNSLAGEAAGTDKKQFGTFYSELYGAGGIIKTAGFVATNTRMRRQQSWINLQKNMTDRPWIAEFADADGDDVLEVLNITKDFLGRDIDYTQALKGTPILYKRPAHDNPNQVAAYRLEKIESLGDNKYRIYEVEVDQYGVEIGEVQSREEHVNTNWNLFTKVFGGYYSLEFGSDGKLTWSENSMKCMVHAMNNIGRLKDESHILEHDYGQYGDTSQLQHYLQTRRDGLDQDDVWQPLKYSDIHYVPNIGAIKSLQFNVNPDGEAVLNQTTPLNFMQIRLAQLGIQLDKEHHADLSEVSMPTQIIQACANRSFTSDYAKEMYTALETLTMQNIEPFMEGLEGVITSDDPQILMETVTTLIVENLLKNSGDDSSVNAILKDLLEKVEKGKDLKYSEDIKGKIPWSDPTISAKLFSSLSTTLTNIAVKMKFAGTLSVICPTERVEKLYGDKLLSSFTPAVDGSGSTRTPITTNSLSQYQQSVIAGNETDSDGDNMLIFDSSRDSLDLPQGEAESVEEYQARLREQTTRVKLSQISKLKTQHNYVLEFSDGSTEAITINSPEDYYHVKNLILSGKKLNYSTPIVWAHPAIGKTYSVEQGAFADNILDWDVEFNRRRDAWIAAKTHTLLNSPEFKAARNEYMVNWSNHSDYIEFVKAEWDRVKQKANLENKILVASPHMLLQLFPEDFNKVLTMSSADFVSRNVARGANTEENSIQWKQGIDATLEEYKAQFPNNDVVVINSSDYLENLLLNGTLASELTQIQTNEVTKSQGISINRIYENVEEGRPLGAYNVYFKDKTTEHSFQMFDLDSINLLFKLNNLWINSKKPIKGYKVFQELSEMQQQTILNQIFNSSAFDSEIIYEKVTQQCGDIPAFDSNFVRNMQQDYPGKFMEVIEAIRTYTKPRAYNKMQRDLFRLSDNYEGDNRTVYVNGIKVVPVDIKTTAYEVILPQVYKTTFGLQEQDDLQAILRDEDFFVKRGLSRFACKMSHTHYDYELKNFNGNHYYILDKTKGIPEELQKAEETIFTKMVKGKYCRVDSDGRVMYEMASSDDFVCNINGVSVIVTDNPLFYVQNLNYNTLKVSPKRVTQESYDHLVEVMQQSKRVNHQNFIKAITNPDESLYSLKTFKEFNESIDDLTYENVKLLAAWKDFKSTAQICRNILQMGRELHTAFDMSLNMIAGRIPAQSQQSFMTQRVIAFDSSGVNTAMVSTFQLFLQGSDLDIDAVTMIGYEFDRNGKYIGWSPYFKSDSKSNLQASQHIPLPTGKEIAIQASNNEQYNFFEVYNKYFGTLFKTIQLPSGKIKTINGVPELRVDLDTAENLKLFADFLRDVNEYGITIKAPVENGLIITTDSEFFKAPDVVLEDGQVIPTSWNLFTPVAKGGSLGVRPPQAYAIAQQLLDVVNRHNMYIKVAPEHLQNKLVKNYLVYYMYKVAESPCNQTEAQESVDTSTKEVKDAAKESAMATASDTYAPGGYETKHKSVGEGQVGKSCVGIGAVAIKANSTTQFYISELLNYGSEWDRDKIMFKRTLRIGGTLYRGFANMYTSKTFSEEEIQKLQYALSYLDSLTSPDQVTKDVAVNIASLLSIAVDNAKDLALAKINSGPKMMGMYAYGLTLGVPIRRLISIINSPEGRILTSLTEGSQFNHDRTAFKVLDAIKKLDGDIGGDLSRFNYICKDTSGKIVKQLAKIRVQGKTPQIVTTQDALFVMMYQKYQQWFERNKEHIPRNGNRSPKIATSLSGMLKHLLSMGAFDSIYKDSKANLRLYTEKVIKDQGSAESATNWEAAMMQMIEYIQDIANLSTYFRSSIGRDLRTLAEGAEEMRILGSILSVNKGLKASTADAETFVDTIENLIYNRKEVLGYTPTETDRIDFHRFMTDSAYQRRKIDEYEQVKHSVNIPHLISKVPHFRGYLKTQLIPTAFFTVASIKYRTMHKYRKNIYPIINEESEVKPKSLFKLFAVDGTREKTAILKGLENLIQYKLFTRWAYNKKLQFKVPKDFTFFTRKGGHLTYNPNSEHVINFFTPAGMASFKKYMEEVYIPQLKNSPELERNEFVKNLIKISYDKTPVHGSVITYSLRGDLMARKGRQAELNARMFADFQQLAHITFQPEMGIPSLMDAFYLYAQYCYMGKKGKSSLMTLFDSASVQGTLARSFNDFVATMDQEGEINCSEEELIAWCAPTGNQHLNSRYGYVSSANDLGISLKQKVDPRQNTSSEDEDYYDDPMDFIDDDAFRQLGKPEKFVMYKPEHLATNYDRLTRNHFLVPITSDRVSFSDYVDLTILDTDGAAMLDIESDMIKNIQLSYPLREKIKAEIAAGTITKFESADAFEQALITALNQIHIPYKVSLYTDQKREINFGILQTIIDQMLNC